MACNNNIESFIKTLKPKKDILFSTVIKSIFGNAVLPITNSKADKDLLIDLKNAVITAGKDARKQGIFTARPNEAGNEMEPFLIKALNNIGLKAGIPEDAKGRKQTVGYPDIYLKDRAGRHNYLEVKTHEYRVDVNRGGLRAFYISPPKPDKSKIIYDARHIIVGFGLEKTARKGKTCFIPRNWKIVSIHGMKVNLKYEFNTDSKGMYDPKAILCEGIY
jgi:hypothetical protein